MGAFHSSLRSIFPDFSTARPAAARGYSTSHQPIDGARPHPSAVLHDGMSPTPRQDSQGHFVDLAAQADAASVPLLRPQSVNSSDTVVALKELDPDYLLIANFQQILCEPVLVVPRRAVVNFHPGPLPRYAGLAPFFWMARNGERDAGVTALITMPGIDDGPILAQRPVALTGTEAVGEIRDRLFAESATCCMR